MTRKIFGRKSVESCLRNSRIDTNHSLDNLFEGKMLNLKHKPPKGVQIESEVDNCGLVEISRPVVICKDPQSFVLRVILDRNLDPQKCHVKIGADDGQGIFKINMQILSSSENGDLEKEKVGFCKFVFLFLSEVCQKVEKVPVHRQGGVHKLLILLAVPQIQELYSNLEILLSELGLENIDFTITSDLKMGLYAFNIKKFL